MSFFDERAEAASKERRAPKPGGGPSRAEIRAVRNALKSRNRGLEGALFSIDTIMQLGRGNPEQGPPQPGTRGYELLTEQFAKVAKEIRKVRDAVDAVAFDAGDKRKIKGALSEAAKSWEARAKMSTSTDPAVVEAAAKAALDHDNGAFSLGKSVLPYFGEKD